MSVKWRIKGGVTVVAGFVLVGLGAVSDFVALGEADRFISTVQSTWLPEPPLFTTYSFALVAFSVIVAGGGVLLIGFARGERDREEALRLDPLTYPPVRHPWRKGLPWFVFIVVVLVLPCLWVVPVAHSYSTEFSVSNCAPGANISVDNVDLPSGAIFVYQWTSSDGRPIGEVWAPSGPPIGSTWAIPDEFINSTYGYSIVQSKGTAIAFWACDSTLSPGASTNQTVILTGTYYAEIL